MSEDEAKETTKTEVAATNSTEEVPVKEEVTDASPMKASSEGEAATANVAGCKDEQRSEAAEEKGAERNDEENGSTSSRKRINFRDKSG